MELLELNMPWLLLAEGAAEGGGLFSSPMLPLLLTMLLFYFLFMLPDRKRQKELEKQLEILKKNDAVITSGGICGIVVNVAPGSKFVTIRVDESNNTKLKVLRANIAHIGNLDEAEDQDKNKDKANKEA
jgi:preprotein translocase subunit YajC